MDSQQKTWISWVREEYGVLEKLITTSGDKDAISSSLGKLGMLLNAFEQYFNNNRQSISTTLPHNNQPETDSGQIHITLNDFTQVLDDVTKETTSTNIPQSQTSPKNQNTHLKIPV